MEKTATYNKFRSPEKSPKLTVLQREALKELMSDHGSEASSPPPKVQERVESNPQQTYKIWLPRQATR